MFESSLGFWSISSTILSFLGLCRRERIRYFDRSCPPLWHACNDPARNKPTNAFHGTPPGTFMPPEAWAAWWGRNFADVPEIDVIAHQDGVGVRVAPPAGLLSSRVHHRAMRL
jgi:hypothetical protein